MKRSFKKLILSAVGIALVAALLPALASATELQAEKKPGEPMPLGSSVSAKTSFLQVSNTGWGSWYCSSAIEVFSIQENGGAVVRLEGTAGGAEPCYRNGSELMTFNKFTLSQFQITKPGEGTISASFTAKFGGGIECSYTGSGTFAYETGTNKIHIGGLQLQTPSEFCKPEVGQPKLEGDFLLSNPKGEKVLIVERPAKWTVQSPASNGGWFQDVTCSTWCLAVGSNGGAMAETWNGSVWTTTAPSGSGLTSVSCAAGVVSCLATPSLGLGVQRWYGSKWSTVTATMPSEATSARLKSVSCGRDTYALCVAVGSFTVAGGKSRTLAELFDGTKWTLLTTPSEEGGVNELNAVSCTSSVSCTAVGRKGGKSVALRWDYSSGWSALAAPKSVSLTDISCTSASACLAVGSGAAERWNGSEWSSTSIAKPLSGGTPVLSGVSCVAEECIATGYYESSLGFTAPLAERWDGSKWEVKEAVNPSPEGESELVAVSCGTVSRCTAVGYGEPSGYIKPLIERYQ